MSRQENPHIRAFIIDNIATHPSDIIIFTAKKFGLSRPAIIGYMHRLCEEGIVKAEGNTKARRYRLQKIAHLAFYLPLSRNIEEHIIWRFRILPHIKSVPKNIIDICQYGFTEILNNAIDHSASLDALISVEQTYNYITMIIIDYGVGIFEKIKNDFHLADPRSALLELSKGKLTSDKTRHAGEGIFFTSRMFDQFTLRSGELVYIKEREDHDEWFIEVENRNRYRQGTAVRMIISTTASWTTKDIFEKFHGDTVGFRKTHVPIKLGQYPGEQLVSRSQAKRVLARFERFSEILLDFEGVQTIGQPFADEIFRVFKNTHPEITIIAIHTTPDIDRMIAFVQSSS